VILGSKAPGCLWSGGSVCDTMKLCTTFLLYVCVTGAKMKLTDANSHFLFVQENCILPVVVDVWLGFCGIKCDDCKKQNQRS
jgi:hypothetical protein